MLPCGAASIDLLHLASAFLAGLVGEFLLHLKGAHAFDHTVRILDTGKQS